MLSSQRYTYSDDSKLMGEALSRLEPGELILEIGVGNGGNQQVVKDKFDLVVGTDILDLHEVKKRNPFAELLLADKATCFRSSVFDVVVFNPPYVPSQTIVDRAVDGGPSGVEVPLEFLESALEVVKKSGKILVLLSSEGDISLFKEFCLGNHLSLEMITERQLFFETLEIFELKMNVSKG